MLMSGYHYSIVRILLGLISTFFSIRALTFDNARTIDFIIVGFSLLLSFLLIIGRWRLIATPFLTLLVIYFYANSFISSQIFLSLVGGLVLMMNPGNEPLSYNKKEINFQVERFFLIMSFGFTSLAVLFLSAELLKTEDKPAIVIIAFLGLVFPSVSFSRKFGAFIWGLLFVSMFMLNLDQTITILLTLSIALKSTYYERRVTSHPLVFFDGACGLCNGAVNFLMREDTNKRLRFATLQGQTAQDEIGDEATPDSIVVKYNGNIMKTSEAILFLFTTIGGPWGLFYIFYILPSALRDLVYHYIARNRYLMFGKLDTCRLPTPEEKAVFID